MIVSKIKSNDSVLAKLVIIYNDIMLDNNLTIGFLSVHNFHSMLK